MFLRLLMGNKQTTDVVVRSTQPVPSRGPTATPRVTSGGVSAGDTVNVTLPGFLVKEMQQGHGGWVDDMEKYLTQEGILAKFDDDGDAVVVYPDGKRWCYNVGILCKVTGSRRPALGESTLVPWDVIRLPNSVAELKRLQEGHGGWAEPMASTIGHYGIVKRRLFTGDVRVKVGQRSWTYNTACCTKVTAAEIERLKADTARQLDAKEFAIGDIVHVSSNEALVRRLQADHGDWADEMKSALGKIGFVKLLFPGGDIIIKVADRVWRFNPDAVAKVISRGTQGLRVGDKVRITSDVNQLKLLQNGHGGYNDRMRSSCGMVGVVAQVTSSGDVRVKIAENTWTFNVRCLEKVAASTAASGVQKELEVGDEVQIINNTDRIKELQRGHGGWSEQMRAALGKKGRVIEILVSGDVRVDFDGKRWTFNPQCISTGTEVATEEEDDAANTLRQLFQLILTGAVTADVPATAEEMIKASGQGRIDVVRKCLAAGHNVNSVNEKKHTALHYASYCGQAEIARLLLERGAKTELQDEDGDTPLHLAAMENKPEVSRILLTSGAKPNSRNGKQRTPMHAAAIRGHSEIILILHEFKADLKAKDCVGDTPMHDATEKDQLDTVRTLLRCNDDLSTSNNNDFTAFHVAARKGNVQTMKLMLQYCPRNRQLCQDIKPDGFNALHLAAFNGHTQICKLLLDEGGASINAVNNLLQTPLHLAVVHQSLATVELLVQKGADMSRRDKDGDTPMHEAIRYHMRNKLGDLSQLGLLGLLLEAQTSSGEKSADQIAVFLASQGADITAQNSEGKSAMDLCLDAELEQKVRRVAPVARQKLLTQVSRPEKTQVQRVSLEYANDSGSNDQANSNNEVANSANSGGSAAIGDKRTYDAELKQLRDQLASMSEQSQCAICMEREKRMVFQCGHGGCEECANQLQTCHICRVPIQLRIRVF